MYSEVVESRLCQIQEHKRDPLVHLLLDRDWKLVHPNTAILHEISHEDLRPLAFFSIIKEAKCALCQSHTPARRFVYHFICADLACHLVP